jgi:transposase
MAPESVAVIIGVDVCKERLDLFEYHSARAYSISNDAAAIKAWLDGFAGRLKLALEPTNRYHLGLAEAAHARGHEVYLIDPYRLSHYRAGLGRRAKTDAQDAQLLARFLEREIGELRPWEPMIPGQQRFWQLLKRRAALVRCKVQLNQSLTGLGLLQEDAEALVQQCEQMIRKLDRALLKQAQELGWAEWIERCQAIPGVGPLTAMALVASWQRGQFRSVDSFVAFLGLDVRVKQSGRWQGRCKLTKKGDGEVRRLLYNAAMQGRRSSQWAPYYLRLRERGMSSTAALVALSRKLAKVSFALLQTNSEFVPVAFENACVST